MLVDHPMVKLEVSITNQQDHKVVRGEPDSRFI